MWICKKCNEEIEDNFDSCWNCTKESDIVEEYVKPPGLNDLLEMENQKKENDFQKLKKIFEDKFPEDIKVKLSNTTDLIIVFNIFTRIEILDVEPLHIEYKHIIIDLLFQRSLLGQLLNWLVGAKKYKDKVTTFIYKEWDSRKEDNY
jgi:hypothetical protein